MTEIPFGELPSTDKSLTAAQMRLLQSWAQANDCTLTLAGEVGFGRECVGMLYNQHYIDFGYLAMDYKNPEARDLLNEIREKSPERAYHKDDCLCVLGIDYEAQLGLYEWVADLANKGIKVKHQEEADLGPGTTTISVLLTGRRAIIGVLYKPE